MTKVAIVLGTRPEIIRLGPLIERLDATSGVELALIHTGQNFDPRLSAVFFEELGVRDPDHHLGIEGGGFAARVGSIIERTGALFERDRPERLLLLGDTDSAMSAYVAKRMGIPVLHMEAGNRCFDDRVPEELNRRIIDQASDVLLPYTNGSRENLLREGFDPGRCLTTGNPIKEVLDRHATRIADSDVLERVGARKGEFLLLTLHRQETVDHDELLRSALGGVRVAAERHGLPVIFSVHPRTRERIARLGLAGEPLRLHEPFGYFDFIALQRAARCVLTDSGTVQEESCILRIPTVTVRESTERPETIDCGSNILAGIGEGIGPAVDAALEMATDWRIPPEYEIADVSAVVAEIVRGDIPGA